ncbi:Trans-acting regulatory protein HvrA [Saezia sanguinis]|uniref:Trans-acting regulatory protein HvrA n=1 Tax=Saezia sanguinis TaxID=1965230 RepID=A0A433SGH7_9BURK|nr:H-NS histone family protein [Saezia sanguinis]RUS67754.1 Trans-acting regulatory protein HvrA [Saezia sanguinis]
MPTDLSKLSLSGLKKLSQNITTEIKKRARQSKREILKEVKKLCAKEGVAFKELLSLREKEGTQTQQSTKQAAKTTRAKQSKKPLKPVYFHQTDPGKTWSGRGRKPLWVVAWIEQGKDMEKLKIRPGKK